MPARRLLALTSELPWPLNTGGHLRTYHLLKALARTFEVRLITTIARANEPHLAAVRDIGVDVRVAAVADRTPAREVGRGLTALAKGEPYVFFHRHNRPAMWNLLRESSRDWVPDAVYFDHLDSFLYRSAVPRCPWIVDLHNVYSTLVARAAVGRHSWPVAALLRHQARLVERMERYAARQATLTMSVSETDARVFRDWGATRVAVVPNGVDCETYRRLPVGRPVTGSPPTVIFVGALSWPPNEAAAQFLAGEFLQRLRQHWSSARICLVGRDPTDAVKSLAAQPGVEVHANVPDVRPFLESAHVLAVPLFAGGGTRLKILEAFAAGLPVVSTSIGCEGLEVTDGVHLAVAERDAMADRVAGVLDRPGEATSMAGAARALAETLYDWNAVGQRAVAAIESATTGH